MEQDGLNLLEQFRVGYQKHIADLIEKSFPGDETIDLMEFQKNALRMPDIKTLVSNNTKKVRERSGSHYVSDSTWYMRSAKWVTAIISFSRCQYPIKNSGSRSL